MADGTAPASVTPYATYYASAYLVHRQAYSGADTSRICCLFSGQGAGFRDALVAAFSRPFVRDAFAHADAFAQEIGAPAPSSYLTAGEQSPVLAAARTLAQFTLQVALWREVALEGPRVRVITGFSSGEFAALVAAGVATFETVFEILAFRERVSPPANELGYMVAIAASSQDVRAAVRDELACIANINSTRQTVIAVRSDSRERVEKILRKRRLPFRTLESVPQPFHTPWLQHVADDVAAFVRQRAFEFAPPQTAIFSSVTKRFLTAGDTSNAAMADLLGAQIVEPVDFPRQVEAAYEDGCVTFLELGAIRVLSSLVPEILIDRFHKTLLLEDVLSIDRGSQVSVVDPDTQRSPFFALLSSVIARMTGYEIESITIEDRFQEDLGIDSIKKADIVFTVLTETDLELTESYDAAAIRNVSDAILLVQRAAPAGVDAAGTIRRGHFVRCLESWSVAPLASAPADGMFRLVDLASLIDGRTDPAALLDEKESGVVIDATAFTAATQLTSASARDAVTTLRNLLTAFRSLAQRGVNRDYDIVLATTEGGDPLPPSLGSFFKSLRIEHPRLFFKHVAFAQPVTETQMIEIARAELTDRRGVDVRYDGAERLTYELIPAPAFEPQPVPRSLVVVAFGAAKGSGLEVLERLAKSVSLRLLLAGRSAVDDEVVAGSLERLCAAGAEVEYETADARDAGAVRRVLSSAAARWRKADVVVNAVGYDAIAPLALQRDADLTAVLESKIASAANILLATAEGLAERSIHFASSTARYGSPGQTAYACANEYVNQMVDRFNRANASTRAVAVNWPPWDGVGMTAQSGVYVELRRSGLALMTAADAEPLFLEDVLQPCQSVVDYAALADTVSYLAPLHDARDLRPLLGDPTTSHGFERTLRPDEQWLRDHRVDGAAYLPAATALAMALALGERAGPTPLRMVQDFEIVGPLIVRDPVKLRVNLRKRDSRVAFIGKTTTPHFQGILAESHPLAPVPPYATAGKQVRTNNLYRPGLFFHGPSFQTLHRARVHDDDVLVVGIETRRLHTINGLPLYDRLMQWIDAAFQALALDAYRRDSVMGLPASVSRVTRADEFDLTGDVQLRVKYLGRENQVVRGDVSIATRDGRPLVELEGIALIVVQNGSRP